MDLLNRVTNIFREENVPYALVGGLAVALHGAVRGTMDIDCIIPLTKADFIACESALRKIGFVPRLPVTAEEVFNFREEYIKNRNLIAWSFYNRQNPLQIVDIIITKDLRTLTKVSKKFGLNRVDILSIDDLIAMKRESDRPQDIEDVKMLEALREKRKK